MNSKDLLTLALEIEGLAMIVDSRQAMTPAEVLPLLREKLTEMLRMVSPEEPVKEEPEKKAEPVIPTVELPEEPSPSQPAPERRELSRLMSINDRFLFKRMLFDASEERMQDAIHAIERMSGADEVMDYLVNDLCFSPEDEAVKEFMTIVNRYFNDR